VQAPRELLAHVQSHGHPIGHLLSSYRSRSPRESAAELASAASYVPESLAPSRDTSVFDDASYASSRVIAAEIHSLPRPVSSQMPTASAQPLAQYTQIPQTYPFSPATVPLAQSSLSVQPPTPPLGSEVMLLREQLQRTTAHLVWLSSNVAKLPRFDTSLSLGLYVTDAHMAMTLPRRASDMAFRKQLAIDFPATMAQAEQMSMVEIARAMAPVYESWQLRQ